jgi:vaccinia related kinase
MNFYLRVGKEEKGKYFIDIFWYYYVTYSLDSNTDLLFSVAEWKTSKRLKQLGMPVLYGFGSHMYKGERYRFLVLPRFGDDLHKVHLKHSKRFHIKTALTLACHIVSI